MAKLERDKAILDLIKHHATLAAGALAIVAAFMKDANGPSAATKWAVGLFILSLLFGLLAFTTFVLTLYGEHEEVWRKERSSLYQLGWLLIGTSWCLISGFVALGVGVFIQN
jgi:hypothetical protein